MIKRYILLFYYYFTIYYFPTESKKGCTKHSGAHIPLCQSSIAQLRMLLKHVSERHCWCSFIVTNMTPSHIHRPAAQNTH